MNEFRFKETEPQVISLGGSKMDSLTIYNYSDTELTFKAGDYFEFTIGAFDKFDERMEPFETLEITAASGPYRGYCR